MAISFLVLAFVAVVADFIIPVGYGAVILNDEDAVGYGLFEDLERRDKRNIRILTQKDDEKDDEINSELMHNEMSYADLAPMNPHPKVIYQIWTPNWQARVNTKLDWTCPADKISLTHQLRALIIEIQKTIAKIEMIKFRNRSLWDCQVHKNPLKEIVIDIKLDAAEIEKLIAKDKKQSRDRHKLASTWNGDYQGNSLESQEASCDEEKNSLESTKSSVDSLELERLLEEDFDIKNINKEKDKAKKENLDVSKKAKENDPYKNKHPKYENISPDSEESLQNDSENKIQTTTDENNRRLSNVQHSFFSIQHFSTGNEKISKKDNQIKDQINSDSLIAEENSNDEFKLCYCKSLAHQDIENIQNTFHNRKKKKPRLDLETLNDGNKQKFEETTNKSTNNTHKLLEQTKISNTEASTEVKNPRRKYRPINKNLNNNTNLNKPKKSKRRRKFKRVDLNKRENDTNFEKTTTENVIDIIHELLNDPKFFGAKISTKDENLRPEQLINENLKSNANLNKRNKLRCNRRKLRSVQHQFNDIQNASSDSNKKHFFKKKRSVIQNESKIDERKSIECFD